MFVNNFVLNQNQSPAIFADVLANRPPAGFAGRIFIATDSLAIYRDNGVGWDIVGVYSVSGSVNYLPVFNSLSSITKSIVYQVGNGLLLNSTSQYKPAIQLEVWNNGFESGYAAVNNSNNGVNSTCSITFAAKISDGSIKKISQVSGIFYDASTSQKGKLLLNVAGMIGAQELQLPFLVGYFNGGARFFSQTERADEAPPGTGVVHVNGKITIGSSGSSIADITVDNNSNAYVRLNRKDNLTTISAIEFSEAGSVIWSIGQLQSNSTFSFFSKVLNADVININHVSGYTSFVSQIKSAGLVLNPVGSGIAIKEGTNATMGAVTLSAGTATVATTKVSANSRIFLTTQSPGGTVGFVYVSARTAGTSFTITSSSSTDTSVVAWLIIEPDSSV